MKLEDVKKGIVFEDRGSVHFGKGVYLKLNDGNKDNILNTTTWVVGTINPEEEVVPLGCLALDPERYLRGAYLDLVFYLIEQEGRFQIGVRRADDPDTAIRLTVLSFSGATPLEAWTEAARRIEEWIANN